MLIMASAVFVFITGVGDWAENEQGREARSPNSGEFIQFHLYSPGGFGGRFSTLETSVRVASWTSTELPANRQRTGCRLSKWALWVPQSQ